MLGPLSSRHTGSLRLRIAGRRAHAAVLPADSCASGRRSRQTVDRLQRCFAACLAGELLERYLFFAACAAPRMPGGLRP